MPCDLAEGATVEFVSGSSDRLCVIDCVEDIVVLLQVWCERFGSLFGVTNLGVSDPFRCQLKCRGGDRCSWN